MVHEVEDFYGVYLLYNLNPRYKGRTYIGYTVDPNRRIKQHNTGAQAGGAWRTDGKGPWEMVLIIHGFPNDISALRFEWAWQHPDKSRRLRHLTKKTRKESAYQYRFRIVCNMLRTSPWNRLALTIRWLKQEFRLDFPLESSPPSHIPVVYGPVKSKKVTTKGKGQKAKGQTDGEGTSDIESLVIRHKKCSVCYKKFKDSDEAMSCYHPRCNTEAHILCLAKRFTSGDPGHVIPVEGPCPGCKQPLLWGDLVRHKRGCYQQISESSANSDTAQDEDGWSDDLRIL